MKVLFICTHNRCRSIMAEAIARQQDPDLLEARSAGSTPEGQVNARALQYLQLYGYRIDGLCSQSWHEFEDFEPDLVITLCDPVAGEICPAWFSTAEKLHWGMADPSKLEGSENEIAAGFTAAIEELEQRIDLLLSALN